MAVPAEGILIGYDGSAGSEWALSWAAREARVRGLALTICHAWSPAAPEPADEAVLALARGKGEQLIARAIGHALCVVDRASVRSVLADGPAGEVLCEYGKRADMVVLGSLPPGGPRGSLLGSISSTVTAYARGPVVVVRGHWRPAGGYLPGPIVAGADGSPSSHAALAFAFEEAALRQAPLLAICAPADPAFGLGGARRIQEDFESTLVRVEKKYPQVPVLRHVTSGGPLSALLGGARGAQMVVVGSRGQGGAQGMRLGSVSQGVLNQAPCPVAVVHCC